MNKTNEIIQALDNTGIRMFMYYPKNKTITIPKNTCEEYQCKAFYQNMPHSFAEDYVHEDDYDIFKELYYKIDRGEKTAAVTFHSKDLKYCNHVTLTTISWTRDRQPKEVLGVIENWSDLYQNKKLVNQLTQKLTLHDENEEMETALKTMATAIGSQYFAVYHIWLDSHTYVCFQEQLPGILEVIGEKGLYEPAWEAYITGYIEEKDQERVRQFVDITTLAQRIGKKNSLTITYKRKEIGWTRGQFIVGKRDQDGLPLTIIYTVADINEEIETRLQKKAAQKEALCDPLTKLWNRKAFEQFKEQERYKCNQSGIILFDIDRFKGINDQFGHEAGDQVIVAIANVMKDILRNKDLVFRVGGDEFAVLLYNCNLSVWNTICRKIETVHTNLKEILPAQMNVTISVGICVNEDGYRDEMYRLADRALYHTKSNGRGGCSLIDLEGNIIGEWHDQSAYLRKGDVLEKNSTVTWRMEIPKNTEIAPRIYGDELYMDLLGIDKTLSPEETFKIVMDLLEPEYKELLTQAAKATICEGQAEAIYMYRHPQKGKIQLRCSSSLEFETEVYYSIVGYIHIMKDMHVFTIEDVHSKIKDALEEIFFCNFYIRLSNYSFEVYKAQPYMTELLALCDDVIDAVNAYTQYMVAEESKKNMKVFLDPTTIRHRMKDRNMIETTYNDPYIGWSRARLLAVDRDEFGEVETVSLVVDAIT